MPAALLALPFGVAIGLSLGLVGAGGSLLTVPVLVYVLGQEARDSTTASLLIVGLSATVGALARSRRGMVSWRVALAFGLPAAAGAAGGTALNRLADPRAILASFGLLMLVAAAALVRERPSGRSGAARQPLARIALAGIAIGVLAGFFGVGGGFVKVPVVIVVLGITIHLAIRTSLAVIALASAAALGGHLATGSIDWAVTGAFTLAAIAGTLAGGRLSARLASRTLTRGFALLVAAVGLVLVADGIASIA